VVVNGTLDATGYVDCTVEIQSAPAAASGSKKSGGRADQGSARRSHISENITGGITLTVPNNPSNSHMIMGLGLTGGYISDLPKTSNSSNTVGAVVADWRWDGINGNNAVWIGSSAVGTRLFLKGSSPEWQAAVPFDSRATPPLNDLLWHNGGQGGVRVYENGTVQAYTGAVSAPAPGSSLELKFSILGTPVRPLDLAKHFSERYAQLSGPANYSFIASQGTTVANMHQGNAINPWINYRMSMFKGCCRCCRCCRRRAY
jgi:hypothetical protein